MPTNEKLKSGYYKVVVSKEEEKKLHGSSDLLNQACGCLAVQPQRSIDTKEHNRHSRKRHNK
jgi:hypothetical protein